MAKLPIITLPDPILRKLSTPVERVDDELRRLADDMLETMYAAPGVGLAAVQVGIPRRLVVIDVADEDEQPNPLVFINPEIVALGSEMRLHEEGCLSIPDFPRRDRAPGEPDAALSRSRRESARDAMPTACWPPPSSTSSITSTAS